MANISAAQVKELRDKTGAGMMDAKSALVECNGDMDAAVDLLRTKGLAKAAKKSSRTAAEGLVGIALEDRKGAVVAITGPDVAEVRRRPGTSNEPARAPFQEEIRAHGAVCQRNATRKPRSRDAPFVPRLRDERNRRPGAAGCA